MRCATTTVRVGCPAAAAAGCLPTPHTRQVPAQLARNLLEGRALVRLQQPVQPHHPDLVVDGAAKGGCSAAASCCCCRAAAARAAGILVVPAAQRMQRALDHLRVREGAGAHAGQEQAGAHAGLVAMQHADRVLEQPFAL